MFDVAVSNIAWEISQDEQIAEILKSFGISAIECAPTKYWPKPIEATGEEIDSARKAWEDRGIRIIAMQALLFGQPQLQLLTSDSAQDELVAYTQSILRLGARLGAKRYVFGSPKNRDASQFTPAEAIKLAMRAWRSLASTAEELGIVFCLEPNPTQYACNFVVLTTEAFDHAVEVNRLGFGVNLDTGIMMLNGEDPRVTVPKVISQVQHVHLSEPQLASLAGGAVDHALISKLLDDNGYRGSVSVEMRSNAEPEKNLEQVRGACEILQKHYMS